MKHLFYKITRWLKKRPVVPQFSDNMMDREFNCPLPTKFFIEPGNICNLRCPFCGTGLRWKGSKRGFMSKHDFHVILDKIAPYTDHISFYNYGEPFLHKDFLGMVSEITQRGINCATHSNLNAYRFNDETAAEVVASGLHFLSASIDGATQESYSKYRVGGSFELAVSNLEKLEKTKKQLSSETPHLVWKFLINKFNEHEQEQAKKIAATIDVPIEFHLMDVWGNEEWKSSLHFQQEVWGAEKDLSRVVGEAPGGAGKKGLPVAMSEMSLHPGLHYWCEQPFDAMVINWNGDLFPCCTCCDDRLVIGNLLTTDIEDLWNNYQYRACREFLYNYGARQHTGSVCETVACELKKKHL
jgi:radical SAM protein with 4Fe4S-binding SPASM domain